MVPYERVLCSQDHRSQEIQICGFINNKKVRNKQLPSLSSVKLQRFLFEKSKSQMAKVESIIGEKPTALKKKKKSTITQNSQHNI